MEINTEKMRNLAILAVFLVWSVAVFGQTDTLTINGKRYMGSAKGQMILDDSPFEGVCHSLISTPAGNYLSVRTSDNKRIVYLHKDNSINEVKQLKNYIVWGFSSKRNALVLSLSDQKSLKISGGDVNISTVSLYDLTTKEIKQLVDYGVNGYTGIYKVSFKDETLTCMVNVKKKIGSDIEPRITKIK